MTRRKKIFNKVEFLLKQLLPLPYRTKYTMDGKKYGSTWMQWFGKCWNIEHFPLDD